MTAQTVTYRCPHCNQMVDVDVHGDHELLVCPNPNCQKPFKVDVPTAQPASELILPSDLHETVPTSPTPLAAVPPAEVEEKALQSVRLEMFRRYPWRCLGYDLLIVVGLLGGLYYLLAGWHFLALVLFVVAGIAAYRLGSWWLRMKHISLMITNKRCVLETGIFTRQVTEMPLDEIADIQVRQTFLQKWMNVGDLVLLSHKGEEHRMIVMAVPSPKEVAAHIREHHA
jgi:uncharacterized membrane protein YdbT with pleckstrin-like domain